MYNNKLLKFIFALIPGAGEMYMGMIKKGALIMLAFSISFYLAAVNGFTIIGCALPVIWFYSFFDTYNIGSETIEQRKLMDNEFMNIVLSSESYTTSAGRMKGILSRDGGRLFAGAAVVAIGGYMLISRLLEIFAGIVEGAMPGLANGLYSLSRGLPTVFAAIILIFAGLRLIKSGGVDNVKEMINHTLLLESSEHKRAAEGNE